MTHNRRKSDKLVVPEKSPNKSNQIADDTVVGFQCESDAKKFQEELKERLLKFGLELHPDKTRLIEFWRYAVENRKKRGDRKPEAFTFLGFTHICGKTRKTGRFAILRHTIKKRLRAKVKEIKDELKIRMHHPVQEVGHWLKAVVNRALPILWCARKH